MGMKLVKAKRSTFHFSRGELCKVKSFKTKDGETRYSVYSLRGVLLICFATEDSFLHMFDIIIDDSWE